MQQSNDSKTLLDAREFKNKGLYKEAAVQYLIYYEQGSGQVDPSLISDIMFCLKKANEYPKALSIGLEAVKKQIATEFIQSDCAWCIYFSYFKCDRELSAEEAISWFEKIMELLPQHRGLHPLPLSVFSFLQKTPTLNPELIVQICKLMNPQLLDTTWQKRDDQKFSYPSQLEKYIGFLSKAYYAARKFAECYQLCSDSLATKDHIRIDQRVWLKRRLALCAHKLGNLDEATSLFEEVLREKKDWYILYEYAQILFDKQDLNRALQYAIRAANAYGDIENKIHLWALLRELMICTKRFDEAITLLKFIASIRKYKAWSVSSELMNQLGSFNIDLDSIEDCRDLSMKVKAMLSGLGAKDPDSNIGEIKQVMPHGKAGFIAYEKGSIYFKASECNFTRGHIAVGTKVSFLIEKSFDPKKNCDSYCAVNITRVS